MSILGFTVSDVAKTYKLFRLNLRTRYFGSYFGALWMVLNPLLMVLVYVFVFSVFLGVTIEGSDNPLDYARWFICGFSPWIAINEGIISSCSAITGNVQLVKSFPIKKELLPMAQAALGLPGLLVGVVVFFILTVMTGAGFTLSMLWLLPALLLTFLFLMGLSFFLSALTVFYRDINQVVGTILMALMFLSAVFSPASSMPQPFQVALRFNPIYQIIEIYRRTLFYGIGPDWFGIAYLVGLSAVLWLLGLRVFRRLSGLFESAL